MHVMECWSACGGVLECCMWWSVGVLHVVERWSAACGKEDALVAWLQTGCGDLAKTR